MLYLLKNQWKLKIKHNILLKNELFYLLKSYNPIDLDNKTIFIYVQNVITNLDKSNIDNN